ncbi:Uncharacterised protein [Salmonella enterica subsp. enterica]|uniref:Uncharacterized protein n=1 Tax=Salmonella enterica I TaxID=59201 RepID=A0A447MZ37_SALET|nr:Uncharacterised protein [Salmonella enterica subsp. enterica]
MYADKTIMDLWQMHRVGLMLLRGMQVNNTNT